MISNSVLARYEFFPFAKLIRNPCPVGRINNCYLGRACTWIRKNEKQVAQFSAFGVITAGAIYAFVNSQMLYGGLFSLISLYEASYIWKSYKLKNLSVKQENPTTLSVVAVLDSSGLGFLQQENIRLNKENEDLRVKQEQLLKDNPNTKNTVSNEIVPLDEEEGSDWENV